MLVTNHVLAGAVLGSLVRRPLPAFLLGVASHFAMDAIPHFGLPPGMEEKGFLPLAVTDGLTGLAAMAWAASSSDTPLATLLGSAGAALPDLDKPTRLFFKRELWPRSVNSFHSGIQTERPRHFPRELLAASLSLLALASLRRR